MADWLDSIGSDVSDWWNRSFGDSSSNVAGGGINDPNLGPTGWSSGGEAQWSPSGGTDWGKVAKALEDLTKGEGDSSSGKATTVSSSPNVAGSTRAVASGSPMNRTNLDDLVRTLTAQRTKMLGTAEGGQGSGKPYHLQRTTGGLLGF